MEEIIDKEGLEEILPHRKKAILIDEIIELELISRNIIATKKILANDPFLEGHFPEVPIYPGYCLIECFNLACAVLAKKITKNIDGIPIPKEMGNIKFENPVFPGDTLRIKATLVEEKEKNIFVFSGEITNQRKQTVLIVTSLEGMPIKLKVLKRMYREARKGIKGNVLKIIMTGMKNLIGKFFKK